MPSKKRVIALRLDDDLYEAIEKLAKIEMRSVANMTEIVLRAGLRDIKKRIVRKVN